MKPSLRLVCLFAAFLLVVPVVAKPKPVALVYVTMVLGSATAFINNTDSKAAGINTDTGEKVYLNVIVSPRTPEYADAVAKNGGKWCLEGSVEMKPNTQYEATLQGDGIDVIVPQVGGKTSKSHFLILAHEWRNLDSLINR